MNLNRAIAGVAIAGLTIFTATSTIPSFAGERVSSQAETQQYSQSRDNRDSRQPNRDRSRECYYERDGKRIRYCCRQRVWNGRSYEMRTLCRPVKE